MKNKLQKIIERSVSNGWKGLEMWSNTFDVNCDHIESIRKRVWIIYEEGDGEMVMLRDLLFDHDFAKSFFGEGIDHVFANDMCSKCGLYHGEWGGSLCEEPWQYHLQQAVLSEDPIDYYYQHLEESNDTI